MIARPDDKLALAIVDAQAYAHCAATSVFRNLEIDEMGRNILETAGREDEAERERKPARRLNTSIARVFLAALADYGYTVVPLKDVK